MKVITIAKKTVFFIPTVGAKNNDESFSKLIQWTQKEGLLDQETSNDIEFITMYSDFENKTMQKPTNKEKLNLKTCLYLKNLIRKKNKEIGITTIPEGKCILGSFEILNDGNEIAMKWKKIVRWAYENGYKKDNRAPFEIYRSSLKTDNTYKIDLYFPIQ